MYDAIVVGARCAGSPTAMLLARKGYRVLLLDRAGFPSDSLSTHYIHQSGGARLKHWGLIEKVAASGCPPIHRQVFDLGPFQIAGTPPPVEGVSAGYAPRRRVLDMILLDAAIESGVEVHEHFAVEGLLSDGDRVTGVRGRARSGGPVKERARIVIGADGVHSVIARLVSAPKYNVHPPYNCAYYTYWSDVSIDTVTFYMRPYRVLIAGPTNDGLTLTIAYWPTSEFPRVRADIVGEFGRLVDSIPNLAGHLRSGRREEKIRGTADLGGFFRRSYGSGWALVGDAAYHKNPITALGITDAFRDAELLSEAIDEAFSGQLPIETAMGVYERKRNESVMPSYHLTCDMARLEPPAPAMGDLFQALRGNEEQTGRFLGTIAGSVPIPEFFSPNNLQRVTGKTLN